MGGEKLIESEIVKAIEQRVHGSKYSEWTIGITNDPDRRRSEHKNDGKDTTRWTPWRADNEQVARDVEKRFQDRGMKGGGGGGENPNFVYIF